MWQWFFLALVVAVIGLRLICRVGCCSHNHHSPTDKRPSDIDANQTSRSSTAKKHDPVPLCH